MFEDKEEKLSISYKDYSPLVINYLGNNHATKVKGFLAKMRIEANNIDKPFIFRILMKELISVMKSINLHRSLLASLQASTANQKIS